jgi:hypothetical protein
MALRVIVESIPAVDRPSGAPTRSTAAASLGSTFCSSALTRSSRRIRTTPAGSLPNRIGRPGPPGQIRFRHRWAVTHLQVPGEPGQYPLQDPSIQLPAVHLLQVRAEGRLCALEGSQRLLPMPRADRRIPGAPHHRIRIAQQAGFHQRHDSIMARTTAFLSETQALPTDPGRLNRWRRPLQLGLEALDAYEAATAKSSVIAAGCADYRPARPPIGRSTTRISPPDTKSAVRCLLSGVPRIPRFGPMLARMAPNRVGRRTGF